MLLFFLFSLLPRKILGACYSAPDPTWEQYPKSLWESSRGTDVVESLCWVQERLEVIAQFIKSYVKNAQMEQEFFCRWAIYTNTQSGPKSKGLRGHTDSLTSNVLYYLNTTESPAKAAILCLPHRSWCLTWCLVLQGAEPVTYLFLPKQRFTQCGQGDSWDWADAVDYTHTLAHLHTLACTLSSPQTD